jgi:hypothetical protein
MTRALGGFVVGLLRSCVGSNTLVHKPAGLLAGRALKQLIKGKCGYDAVPLELAVPELQGKESQGDLHSGTRREEHFGIGARTRRRARREGVVN